MKKRFYSLACILLVLLAMAGCLYDGKHSDLYHMVKSNVLCTNGAHPGQYVTIEVLETDSYGRRLFSYSIGVPSSYGYDQICVVAVSQKTVLNRVYYYEDACFILADAFEKLDEEMISALKEKNDWDEPMNHQKMSRRRIHAQFEETVDVPEAFNKEVRCEPGSAVGSLYMDFDGKGKVLYYVLYYDKDYKDNVEIEERFYIAIVNEDGTYDPETWLEELQDLYGYQEQVHEFKTKNGWTFGTS